MAGHKYISPELQAKIHKVFATGAATYKFADRETAVSIRRLIYRERARLKREAPDTLQTLQASALIFKIDDTCLRVIHESQEPTLESTLDRAIQAL